MVPSTFFFLFSQLGVGMMLGLLFLSPRRIGNGFFKFASLTAAILMGVPLAFDYFFPSPYRSGYAPAILLLASIVLTVLYNRVVNLDKFDAALALPEPERALLAEQLWDSLSSEPEAPADDELLAELDRRFQEYQRDPSTAVPWTEIKRQG